MRYRPLSTSRDIPPRSAGHVAGAEGYARQAGFASGEAGRREADGQGRRGICPGAAGARHGGRPAPSPAGRGSPAARRVVITRIMRTRPRPGRPAPAPRGSTVRLRRAICDYAKSARASADAGTCTAHPYARLAAARTCFGTLRQAAARVVDRAAGLPGHRKALTRMESFRVNDLRRVPSQSKPRPGALCPPSVFGTYARQPAPSDHRAAAIAAPSVRTLRHARNSHRCGPMSRAPGGERHDAGLSTRASTARGRHRSGQSIVANGTAAVSSAPVRPARGAISRQTTFPCRRYPGACLSLLAYVMPA